ncbi:MAG: flagellar protein FlaG [Methyloprofundus sp.]|nr:flagellar protein FlaG [Methyloprofundus sp.]MDT8425204.1 flagellar protein FlaG [Methyloprofundus sp.]
MIHDITNVSLPPLVAEVKSTSKLVSVAAEEPSISKRREAEGQQNTADKKTESEKIVSLSEARKLADEGNKILQNVQRNLQFKVDDSTQQVVMSIVDKATGDVIRQVPSEDVLALAKRMQDSDGKSGSIKGYIA